MADDDLSVRHHGCGASGLNVHLMLDGDDPPKIEAQCHMSEDGGDRWIHVTFWVGPQMHAIILSGQDRTVVAALRDALMKAQTADEAGPGSVIG